jgi:membrane protein
MTFNNRIKDYIKETKNFFSSEIWALDGSDLSKIKKRVVRRIKVTIITMRGFSEQSLGWQAVSLSFFTTMAFIPFVAVVFSLTNGFGLGLYLKNLLYQNFTNQEIIDTVIGFADNIIRTSQEGPYGFISFGAFLWLVIWLMLCVERCFNKIWKVEKSRVIWKKFISYITILLLSPFVIILFLSMFASISSGITSIGVSIPLFYTRKIVLFGIFILFAILLFTCMFIYIPNAKVKFMPAFKAAVLSALAFALIQFLYLETQIFVSRMNSVYGVFAAVPLFMVWVNFGWFIILLGSDISYALQNVDNYNNNQIDN